MHIKLFIAPSKISLISIAVLFGACEKVPSDVSLQSAPEQSKSEIEACVRKMLKYEEGEWDYTGVIAKLNGSFSTYIEKNTVQSNGVDKWMLTSIGDGEADNHVSYSQLVGNQVIPVEEGEVKVEAAFTYTSCTGPDESGRFTATSHYKMPLNDDGFLYVKANHWVSEKGTFYAEDLLNEVGEIVARRTNITTPSNK